ncbi:hypothetical protein F383_27061 [Gossypium arboreum]|uniref:Uncharacterized protein n=1 Tax=Gossypium arboreum TaxID=29729 RepID=A0A0B0P9T8_GOSAR|nr:hypothetical protein F383_27061 [Gossypium arboreum]
MNCDEWLLEMNMNS